MCYNKTRTRNNLSRVTTVLCKQTLCAFSFSFDFNVKLSVRISRCKEPFCEQIMFERISKIASRGKLKMTFLELAWFPKLTDRLQQKTHHFTKLYKNAIKKVYIRHSIRNTSECRQWHVKNVLSNCRYLLFTSLFSALSKCKDV